MSITNYPLSWPVGWRRAPAAKRTRAKFGTAVTPPGRSYSSKREVTIAEAVSRLRDVLRRMRISDDDLVISSNLELRLDGLPRGNQRDPADPGVAVYWTARRGEQPRCMAIDRYDRVADNLAAVAATLDAMRAIERHGGAVVLERAFAGLTELPAPEAPGQQHWSVVLGVPASCSTSEAREAYKRLVQRYHPDKPTGDPEMFSRVQQAWRQVTAEHGAQA